MWMYCLSRLIGDVSFLYCLRIDVDGEGGWSWGVGGHRVTGKGKSVSRMSWGPRAAAGNVI